MRAREYLGDMWDRHPALALVVMCLAFPVFVVGVAVIFIVDSL
jgi:hypothetical protein